MILRLNDPTPWLSNIHPVSKPGSVDEVRITIDMRSQHLLVGVVDYDDTDEDAGGRRGIKDPGG